MYQNLIFSFQWHEIVLKHFCIHWNWLNRFQKNQRKRVDLARLWGYHEGVIFFLCLIFPTEYKNVLVLNSLTFRFIGIAFFGIEVVWECCVLTNNYIYLITYAQKWDHYYLSRKNNLFYVACNIHKTKTTQIRFNNIIIAHFRMHDFLCRGKNNSSLRHTTYNILLV